MRVRAALIVLGLLGSSALLAAQAPIPAGKVVAGTLTFDGHASVGDFVGKTDSVSGEMSGGPDLTAIRGWVEAPVKSLRTGKGKRDSDMNKSMESDTYPVIRYELDSVSPGAIAGDTTNVVLHGRFLIHGVTRDASLDGKVVLHPQGARVWADTPLNLKDYKIGGLSKVLGILKMSEKIEVHVDLTFAAENAPAGSPTGSSTGESP